MAYEITDKHPIPDASEAHGETRASKYPFGAMKVGDSFATAPSEAYRVKEALRKWNQRHERRKFTWVKSESEFRIWRID